MNAVLTFTEVGHLYLKDGQVVPSVTQVLDLAGIDDFPQIPWALANRERAGALGKAVHMCCHYLDDGTLDVDTVDKRIAGYVYAYHKFREQYQPQWSHMEEPMVSDGDLPFAGTADRIGTLAINEESMRFVLDIKTAKQLAKHCCLQTAGYYLLSGGDPLRAVLHLKENGEFVLRPHREESDIEIFKAALKVAHWRLLNGAKVNGESESEC